MAVQFTATVRNAMLDAITAQVGASGQVRVYSGSAPATADTALSGNTLLVTLSCSATFAPAASSGTLTLNAITQANAAASGTASFFRILKSDGTTVIWQGTVGTSGADLNLNTTSIASGGPVSISSWTLSIPA